MSDWQTHPHSPVVHDLDQLLQLIKELEERIINLEVSLINARIEQPKYDAGNDAWYWEHG